MALKCYFDAGNKSDPRTYKTLTLCAVAGTDIQWRNFDSRWDKLRSKLDFPYIHVTDMLAAAPPFTKENGWSRSRVNSTLSECVSLIGDCKARPENQYNHGILPFSVTVILRDFQKILAKVPQLRTPELNAVNYCVQMCGYWSDYIGVNRLALTFDRNEPFKGHVCDRWNNKRARREESIWKYVTQVAEANSEEVPGLQVADLIAWSVGKYYEGETKYTWQRAMLSMHKERELYDYQKLKSPDLTAMDLMDRLKIPKRRPFPVSTDA